MAFKHFSLVFFFCLWTFSSFTLCKEEKESESLLNSIKDKIIGHKEEAPQSTLEKIQNEASHIAEKLQEIPQVIRDSVIGTKDDGKKDKESIAEVIIDAAGQIKDKVEEVAAAVGNIASTVQQKYEENAPKTTYENIRDVIKDKMTQNQESDNDKKKEKEEKEKKEKEEKEKKEKEDKAKKEKEDKAKKEKEDKEKKDKEKKEKEEKDKKEKDKKEKERKEKEEKDKKKGEKSTFEKLKEFSYSYLGKQDTTKDKDEGIISKIMSVIYGIYNAFRLKMGL